MLADGTWKNVEDLKYGDDTMFGGRVTGAGYFMCDNMYDYRGTRVSGTHLVFDEQDDGSFVWLRVNQSKHAVKVDGEQFVYPVGTHNHLLVTETHVGADVFELDNYDQYTQAEIQDMYNNDRKVVAHWKSIMIEQTKKAA